MILRRIAIALREQSWFNVFVELALIVVGVFLGIQVSNWNESRADRQLEVMLIQHLAADFRDIEDRAASDALAAESRIEILESLSLALSDNANRPNLDGLLEEFSDAAGTTTSIEGSATYEEMLATGRLGLIRSQTLRDALAEYNRIRVRAEAAQEINWGAAFSVAPEVLRAGSLARGVLSGKGATKDFEREFSEILSGEDIYRDVAAFLDIQKFILAWATRRLEAARTVRVELGEENQSRTEVPAGR